MVSKFYEAQMLQNSLDIRLFVKYACTFCFSYYNSLLSCLSTAAQTCSSSTFAVTYAIKSYQPIMSMYLPSCQLSYGKND